MYLTYASRRIAIAIAFRFVSLRVCATAAHETRLTLNRRSDTRNEALSNNSERGCNFRWPLPWPPATRFRMGSLIRRSNGRAHTKGREERLHSRVRNSARGRTELENSRWRARARNSTRVFSFRRATSRGIVP